MAEKRIYTLLEKIYTLLKNRLPDKGYKTETWNIPSTGTWLCPKTGMVTVDCRPSDNSESYLYIKDVTDNIRVFAHYQINTTAQYAGQFAVFEGHEYQREHIANIASATSSFKYTYPTGSGGGSVRTGISRFVRWCLHEILYHLKVDDTSHIEETKCELGESGNYADRNYSIQFGELHGSDNRGEFWWGLNVAEHSGKKAKRHRNDISSGLVCNKKYIREHIKDKSVDRYASSGIYSQSTSLRKIARRAV